MLESITRRVDITRNKNSAFRTQRMGHMEGADMAATLATMRREDEVAADNEKTHLAKMRNRVI